MCHTGVLPLLYREDAGLPLTLRGGTAVHKAERCLPNHRLAASGSRVGRVAKAMVTKGSHPSASICRMPADVRRIRMKFMLITDTFPPLINGVSRTLQILATGLAKAGHSVEVITTVGGGCTHERLKITTVPSMPLPGYPGLRLGYASRRSFEKRMAALQPDGVYVAVESLMGVNAVSAAGRLGLRVVTGFHTNFHSYSRDYRLPIFKGLAARYLGWFHNRATRTLTPSMTTADELRGMGITRLGVMGRGVDAELFHPSKRDRKLRASIGATDDTPVALYAGRIAAEKNLELAISAFLSIRRVNPSAQCVFAGGGPRVPELRAKYPEFYFAGACDDNLLARWYASADVFVFPSLTETYGNVIAEAMASGLVTVAFNYAAGQKLIRHYESGFLAPFGDRETFLFRVLSALDHWRDQDMRAAARRAVEPLAWSDIVKQFEHELAGPRVSSAPASNNTLLLPANV